MRNRDYPMNETIPKPASIADMISRQAETMPDAVVFRFRKGKDEVESRTFADVCREVKKAASWISGNYGTGNHIAIIGENSYEWIISFLGTLCSGNVAVPIDKELPAGEVAWMIDRADITKAFVSKTYMDLVEGIDGLASMSQKQLLDKEGENAEEFCFYEPSGEELACIFFTSGTSGRSKGVMLSHGSLAAELYYTGRMCEPVGKSSLVVLPFHHAFGLVDGVLAMYNGGMNVFLNRSLRKVKEDFLLAKPEIVMLVPMFIEVFYKGILDGIKKSGREKKFNTGIRISQLLLKFGIDRRRTFFKEIHDSFGGNLYHIIAGGAHLDPMYVREFRKFGIEILNGYGTTECSPCVAMNRVNYHKDGSVGQPLECIQTRISPEGEVQFKGDVVMMGYYKDPENTEAVLKDGWYSTGDLGYLDPDGFLFLTGRTKNLIILSNGENISPEELENDFHADPAVCEVLVYEQDRKIIAEIFPEEEYRGNTEYFEALKDKVNKGRPVYKQVASVRLRDQEFIKNTTKKIVRYKNIPHES